jgi:hypothetical protein
MRALTLKTTVGLALGTLLAAAGLASPAFAYHPAPRPTPPTAHHGSSVENTGVADTGPAPLSAPSDASKVQGRAAAISQLAAQSSGGVVGFTCIPACPPTVHTLAIGTIFYEGQGNGGATYTCGPSASRNMVYNMTGADYGEGQFATWENTSSIDGTAITNIKSALNTHFSSWSSWGLDAPASKTDLLADAITDTYYATHQQEMIQNVQTSYLSFWNGHSAKHYDDVYGYDQINSYIYVAEEWDHVEGSSSPYGKHIITATMDFNAVHGSPTAEVVY